MRGNLGGGDYGEFGAVLHRAALGVAQRLCLRPGKGEAGKLDARLFAIFDDRQPKVDRLRQARRADLIEQDASLRRVGHLAQLPQEIGPAILVADRIAHHDPVAALHPVHQEGVALVGEQEALVAGVGQKGIGAVAERQRRFEGIEPHRRIAHRAGRRRE